MSARRQMHEFEQEAGGADFAGLASFSWLDGMNGDDASLVRGRRFCANLARQHFCTAGASTIACRPERAGQARTESANRVTRWRLGCPRLGWLRKLPNALKERDPISVSKTMQIANSNNRARLDCSKGPRR
jgi:hypothetical protein